MLPAQLLIRRYIYMGHCYYVSCQNESRRSIFDRFPSWKQ